MTNSQSAEGPNLPPPPERPDCCAGGCAICVLDEYLDEMQRWHEDCARIEAEFAANS
jgi:hypothetical protein